MQATVQTPHAQTAGLLSSIRRLARTFSAVVQTRAELLAAEIQREKAEITRMLVFGAVAAFLLLMGVMMLNIFIIAAFWDNYRLEAIGALTAIYVIAGVIAILVAKRAATRSTRPFAASVAEFKKDKELLDEI
jgi:uncharacterized membrane protein YqjE